MSNETVIKEEEVVPPTPFHRVKLEGIDFGSSTRIDRRELIGLSPVDVQSYIDQITGDAFIHLRTTLYGQKVHTETSDRTYTSKKTLVIDKVPSTWWIFTKATFVEWLWKHENRLLKKCKPLAKVLAFIADRFNTSESDYREITHTFDYISNTYATIDRYHVAPFGVLTEGKDPSRSQSRFDSVMSLAFVEGQGKTPEGEYLEDKVLARYRLLEEFVSDIDEIFADTLYDPLGSRYGIESRYRRFKHESERLINN